MNAWSAFERLARIAREEQPPGVDVTAQVLARIQSDSGKTSLRLGADDDRLELLLGAAIALAAASVALMFALPTWEALNDPLAGWLQAYEMVLQ